MMRPAVRLPSLLVTLGLWVAFSPTAAVGAPTGDIVGIVLDDRGAGVPYANIVLKNTALVARANPYGVFRVLHVPVGTYTVATRLIGYAGPELARVRVRDGEVTRIELRVAEVSVRVNSTGDLNSPGPRIWVPPCPAPRVTVDSWARFKSWVRLESGNYSLLLPPDFHEMGARGIEPEVRNFHAADAPIGFSIYWGIYSDPLSKSSQYSRYATCSEWIGGKLAKLMTAERKSNGGAPDEGFVAAAAWRDVTPNLNLTIWGEARDRPGLETLLTILRTIRFEEDRGGAPAN